MNGWIVATLGQMTLEDKVGQLFMVSANGARVDDPDPWAMEANRALHGLDTFAQLITRYGPGGVVYFGYRANVEDPAQVARLSNGIQRACLSERAAVPALIAADQEHGLINRILEPATQLPGAMGLGAGGNPEHAFQAAAIAGRELAAMGINQVLAPVADVCSNPRNPVIGARSFGADPALVSEMVRAQVAGYRDAGVAATAKHFPGHGDTDVDSHFGMPTIGHSLEEIRSVDLPPFQGAIEAGVDAVMTAHVAVPALDPAGRPATLSAPVLTGLLREELGFDGVIVTDALSMAGAGQTPGAGDVAVEALAAGADVLLEPPDVDAAYRAVLAAVLGGTLAEERIDASVSRILALKDRLGLAPDPFVDETAVAEVVGCREHLAVADEIAAGTITLVKNGRNLLPLLPRSGQKVAIVGCEAASAAALAGFLAEGGLTTEAIDLGASPSRTGIDTALDAVRSVGIVLVATMKAWASPEQQDLVRALVRTAKPVVVLAMAEPYDLALFDEVETALAAYSFRGVSLRAAARVLLGEVPPRGRLPIPIR